jgi:acyl carrier protein/GNAT superfamily N-acetyltransferase
MTHDEAAEYVVATLRRTVWLGATERTASLEQPLGADGLGLDSLGVVEFLSELESSLHIHFPDEFWSRGPRTLGDIVEFIAAARSQVRLEPEHARTVAAPPTSEVQEAIHEQGFWRGLGWVVQRIQERYGRVLYARQRQLLLERDLTAGAIRVAAAALPLEFRAARPADVPPLAASAFWSRSRTDYWLRLFQERYAAGSHCFVALHQGQIVGIDWVSGKNADTALIGLQFAMRPGTCVGENLMEHRAYRHQGIGMALLTYSLEQSRVMGYARQVTLVSAWNHRMLVTAVQLLGFQVTGELVTTWRLGRPRTAWRVDGPNGGANGEGGTLTV